MSKIKNKKPAKKLTGVKLFVEIFLKHEGEKLSTVEIARTRKEKLKNITDGEFWWKVCKEYNKKSNLN